MQVWRQQGANIVNAANGECLAIANMQCGSHSLCNKYLNQSGTPGTMYNVIVQPCNANDPSQSWMLIPQYDHHPLEWTPLEESATRYPPANDSIFQEVASNLPRVRPLLHSISWKNAYTVQLYANATASAEQDG